MTRAVAAETDFVRSGPRNRGSGDHVGMLTFERIVARQGGVISLRQAVECGMSAATVQRRTREGVWERLHPAVYLVGGHRLTGEARIRAAGLWAGERAAVSGTAAAFVHGMLPAAPATVEVTVPEAVHPRPQHGIVAR